MLPLFVTKLNLGTLLLFILIFCFQMTFSACLAVELQTHAKRPTTLVKFPYVMRDNNKILVLSSFYRQVK